MATDAVAEAVAEELPVFSPEMFDTAPKELLQALEALDLIDTARGEGVEAAAAFGRYVFGVAPAAHHRQWLAESFESDRICIQAPPSSAKTTWVTIIRTAWLIGKNPLKTNGIISSGDDAAEDMAKAVADTIELNSRWKEVFPNVVPYKEGGWSNDGYNVRDTRFTVEEWARKRAGKKDATLTAGGIGSARFNGLRITGTLTIDDGHDRKSKDSDSECKRVVDFIKDTAEPRVEEGGSLLIVQTRWNPKDSVNHCENLVREDGSHIYKVFKHPALDPETGESYWPAKRSLASLKDMRVKLGEIDFQLIYLGNETATQGQILKREAIHWFPVASVLSTWVYYGGVDFAQKLQELSRAAAAKHSRFAYAILGYNGTHLVLVDGYVDLIAMGEAENVFFSLTDVYRPARVGIETNAQNRGYYNNLIRRKLNAGYAWLNLMPINTSKNMGIRMGEMEPDFRLGTIQVSDGVKPFLKEFMVEWLSFGMKGARDDTLSAVGLARESAYNLLPRESAEGERERKAKPVARHPFVGIEKYYGVGH